MGKQKHDTGRKKMAARLAAAKAERAARGGRKGKGKGKGKGGGGGKGR